MKPKISLEDLPLADIIAYLEALPPNLPYSSLIGAPAVGGSVLASGRGADIVGGTPITVDHEVHGIIGGGTLSQINGFEDGAKVVLIAANAAFSIDSSRNVWATSATGTRVIPIHAAVTLVYDSDQVTWHVAGVGS